RAAPARARRVGPGCGGPGVSAPDRIVPFPCGGSACAAPRRGEVPAVRPAPQRSARLRVTCPRRGGAIPRRGGGGQVEEGGGGGPGGAGPRRGGRGVRGGGPCPGLSRPPEARSCRRLLRLTAGVGERPGATASGRGGGQRTVSGSAPDSGPRPPTRLSDPGVSPAAGAPPWGTGGGGKSAEGKGTGRPPPPAGGRGAPPRRGRTETRARPGRGEGDHS